jgi:hypothetical protein
VVVAHAHAIDESGDDQGYNHQPENTSQDAQPLAAEVCGSPPDGAMPETLGKKNSERTPKAIRKRSIKNAQFT